MKYLTMIEMSRKNFTELTYNIKTASITFWQRDATIYLSFTEFQQGPISLIDKPRKAKLTITQRMITEVTHCT